MVRRSRAARRFPLPVSLAAGGKAIFMRAALFVLYEESLMKYTGRTKVTSPSTARIPDKRDALPVADGEEGVDRGKA